VLAKFVRERVISGVERLPLAGNLVDQRRVIVPGACPVDQLIGGRKMEHLGFVPAANAESAVIAAGDVFDLSPEKRKRLAVNPCVR
jgi:hypothetical protein